MLTILSEFMYIQYTVYTCCGEVTIQVWCDVVRYGVVGYNVGYSVGLVV